jgi:hypothetical protein
MKRISYFWLAAILTTVAVSTIAAAQSQPSLGAYARAVKKTQSPAKTSAKVYDNDNLPSNSSLSVVGHTPEPAAADKDKDKDKNQDQSKDGEAKADKAAQLKPGQAAEEREKALAAWKAKLDEQMSQISLLSRELDVLQREYKLKASDFYNNTAMRTQNPTAFAADDAKYKQQIAEKQKAVDAAKAKLTGMQDEARKSGAPNSVAE